MTKGIISLGEALIDFIPLTSENTEYQKSPGGAPANVAVGLARLGAKSTFLGKVGDDSLGHFLKDTLTSYGVKTDGMTFTQDVRTGVVFVSLAANGERSFEFFINPSADQMLQVNDVEESLFDEHRVLHFGTISMINEPAKEATKHAVQVAREKGLVVSFDPNLRMSLWSSEDQAKEAIISMLDQVDVLKVSEEELEFITGEKDIEAGIKQINEKYNIPFMLVTLGGEGSYVVTNGEIAKVDAMKVNAVDTTGAGDAFVSGILYSINETDASMEDLSIEQAVEMAKMASVSGALAASTKGAMTALPTIEQVKQHLSS
ncbi:aminoimidazole riboside kinase [Pontibacillus salipaludis]|uniref:aminoimidazole riboside kinase n=1 Tax=Pontibacillus salipaludis TaxID=1697394 RepID=UPI0031E84B67